MISPRSTTTESGTGLNSIQKEQIRTPDFKNINPSTGKPSVLEANRRLLPMNGTRNMEVYLVSV